MAITYRSSASLLDTTERTGRLDLPADVQDGDMILFVLSIANEPGALPNEEGYREENPYITGFGFSIFLYEPGTYSLYVGVGQWQTGEPTYLDWSRYYTWPMSMAVAVFACDPGNWLVPVHYGSQVNLAVATSRQFPATFAPGGPGMTSVWVASSANDGTSSTPAGMTKLVSGGSLVNIDILSEVLAAGGSSGTRTQTTSVAARSKTASMVLEEQSPFPPNALTGLTATPLGATKIRLRYLDTNVLGWPIHVERSTDNVTFTRIDDGVTSIGEIIDDTLSPDTTYYYKIFSYNDVGDTPFTNVASAHTVIPDLWQGIVVGSGESATNTEIVGPLAPTDASNPATYGLYGTPGTRTGDYRYAPVHEHGPRVADIPPCRTLRFGFWFNQNGTGQEDRLFCFNDGDGTILWGLMLDSDHRVFGFREGTIQACWGWVPFGSVAASRAQEWVHVAFTQSSGFGSLYLNGIKVLQTERPFDPESTAGQLHIYRRAFGASASVAKIDDIYVQVSDYDEQDTAPPALRFAPFRVPPHEKPGALAEGERLLYQRQAFTRPLGWQETGLGLIALSDFGYGALQAVAELDGEVISAEFLHTIGTTGYRAHNRYFFRAPDGDVYGEIWTPEMIGRGQIGVEGV